MYNFKADPNVIMSIPNFMQIDQAVVELNHVDRHDQPYMSSFHAYHARNA